MGASKFLLSVATSRSTAKDRLDRMVYGATGHRWAPIYHCKDSRWGKTKMAGWNCLLWMATARRTTSGRRDKMETGATGRHCRVAKYGSSLQATIKMAAWSSSPLAEIMLFITCGREPLTAIGAIGPIWE